MKESNVDPVIGATIVNVRPMTKEEMAEEGWEMHNPLGTTAIVLSSGVVLYPSADWEGNGPGAIFGKTNEGGIYLDTVKK